GSFEQSLIETMPQVLRADVVISAVHVGADAMEAPVDESVLAQIRTVPGVTAVVGERLLNSPHDAGLISINVFDAEYFSGLAFGEWHLVGPRLENWQAAVASNRAVLVSTNFAANLGVTAGDSVILKTPSGPLPVTVAGMTADFLSPRGTVEMNRELFKSFWRDADVTHCLVRSAPERNGSEVSSDIGRALGHSHNWRILTLHDLVTHIAGEVRRAFAPLQVLAGVVLLVVLAGMADTLVASIVERTREIGISRAIGVRQQHIH